MLIYFITNKLSLTPTPRGDLIGINVGNILIIYISVLIYFITNKLSLTPTPRGDLIGINVGNILIIYISLLIYFITNKLSLTPTPRGDLIGINELLDAVQKFQNVSEDSQLKYVLEVLDQDKDGAIDINDALKVI